MEKGCVNKGWGKLYIVATPIGNLGEITYRAVEVLKSVDIVACEDTRKSAVLLSRYDIKKPMLSYRQHNERASAKGLVEQLVAGKSIALITD
ncbi:MAG: SAM-dependent methyltransferase, partial [Firmicutes bacterium]|nr:SAM-dependent methyltransferase [Bacillota bacterium]